MARRGGARTVAAMNLMRAARPSSPGTYLIGAVIALATGLGSPPPTRLGQWDQAVVAAPHRSPPSCFCSMLVDRADRPAARPALATGLSLAAAGFDGDVGHAGLTGAVGRVAGRGGRGFGGGVRARRGAAHS